MFKKYMHIERYGNTEVQGIELGDCYIFPKLDGTNGSVWLENSAMQCGSRKRQLSLDSDNAGFYKWILCNNERYYNFLFAYSQYRLYGEWLVPHTLKNYTDNAWHNFYVFDVFDDEMQQYLPYDVYAPLLDKFGITYVPPLCRIKGATYDHLLTELNNNMYLIKDGEGIGEGIVIKNYDYQNKYGRTTWAKIVCNHFKAEHNKNQTTIKKFANLLEEEIVFEYVDSPLVDKVFAKIVNAEGGWNSKQIPRLFNTVYYDLITEELWDILKKYKQPLLNFATIYQLTIKQIKKLKPELF